MLLYGSAVWRFTKKRKLLAAEMSFWRRSQKYKNDKTSNHIIKVNDFKTVV